MKKLISILMAAMFIALVPVTAFSENQTLTFSWDEPSDLDIISRWELYWSETVGGPYTKISDIPKVEGMTVFQAPATVDVTGPAGSIQERFFVLIACGTLQEAGAPVFKCSANSEEISHEFIIPPGEFKVPVNFRVKAE